MSTYSLILVALALAIADWIALAKGWRRAIFILKPAVMLAILAWLALIGGFSGWLAWFSLGILFSLLGDILLLLRVELFLAGLVAFLLAHLSYTIGFNPASLPQFNLTSLVLAGFVALPAVEVFNQITTGARASGQSKLVLPMLAYIFVISLMAWSALLTLTRSDWQTAPALLVSAGAILFLLSDALLGLQKFVAPLKHGNVKCMAAYHLGQILIVLGAAIHYLA